jgi:hypothetical protein
VVEVRAASAHAAEVQGVHRAQHVGGRLDVVVDDEGARSRTTSKSSNERRAPSRAKPSASASR